MSQHALLDVYVKFREINVLILCRNLEVVLSSRRIFNLLGFHANIGDLQASSFVTQFIFKLCIEFKYGAMGVNIHEAGSTQGVGSDVP